MSNYQDQFVEVIEMYGPSTVDADTFELNRDDSYYDHMKPDVEAAAAYCIKALHDYNNLERKKRSVRMKLGQGIIRPIRIVLSGLLEIWEQVFSEDDYVDIKITKLTADANGDMEFEFSKNNSFTKAINQIVKSTTTFNLY